MPLRKTDPEKYCEYCGSRLARKRFCSGVLESMLHFGRRKYCDQKCMAKAFDARPSRSVSKSMTHFHARKMVPPGSCERCGKSDATDVHHKDGDHTNNSLENLERICRSCHMRHHHPKPSCVICGRPVKGHGYCDLHYQRLKKHGDPLAYKIPPRKMCRVCGIPAHSGGLCGRHYMQQKRGKLTI